MKFFGKNILLIFGFSLYSFFGFSQNDKNANNDTILVFAEQMPEYPGGIHGIIRQVATAVDYPKEARENYIDGTVFLRFEVTKTGNIGKIEIQKSVHPLLDNAAMHAVMTLKKFKPAIQNGKPVNVWMSIPVKFNIPGPKKTMPVFKSVNGLSLVDNILVLMSDLAKNRKPNIYGTVDLKVEITKTGKIGKIERIKGIRHDFDQKVIDKIRLLPEFKPATENGKPVNSYIHIPVNFEKKNNIIKEQLEFKDSSITFEQYIDENLNYPKEALYAGMEGKVITEFELTGNSEIKNIHVVNSSNPVFEDEAIRLINSLPKLKPKLIKGKFFDVKYSVPIKFDKGTLIIEKPKCSEDKDSIINRFSDSIKKYINEDDIPEKLFLFLEIKGNGKIAKKKIIYGRKDKQNNKIDSLLNQLTKTLAVFTPGKINGRISDTWYVIPVFGEPIFIYVKKMPEFPGGVMALKRYIAENVAYPSIARNNGIQGTIFIRFEVTKTGGIGKVEIQKGVHPLLDNAAIKVIKSLPKFIPGEGSNGVKVNVWYSIPVTFKLS